MRAVVGIVYWLVVGLLDLFGLYAMAYGTSFSWLLIPAALALLGAWWLGLGYSGAGLIVFGAYPALILTRSILDQLVHLDWSCSDVAWDGIANPNGGIVGCTTVSFDLMLFGLGMWMLALLGRPCCTVGTAAFEGC